MMPAATTTDLVTPGAINVSRGRRSSIRPNVNTRPARTTAALASHGTRHHSQVAESTGGWAIRPVGYTIAPAMTAAVMCHTNMVSTTEFNATTTVQGPSLLSHALTARRV